MEKRLFVGNLPSSMGESDLEAAFADHGTVVSAVVIRDRETGRSRGFGFIEMEGHEARAAIAGLNVKIIGDKSLKVQFEEPRKGGKRGGRRH